MLSRSLSFVTAAAAASALAACAGNGVGLPPASTLTTGPAAGVHGHALHFLIREAGIMDGTSATIKTGISLQGTAWRVKVLLPQSGITASLANGNLRVRGKCPTFTPATDIAITDNHGNSGSINVACTSIPPGLTSYASPFLLIVEPKAQQTVFLYGLKKPISIQPHNASVTSVSKGTLKNEYIIKARAVGSDGVSFQDNAQPPDSAGVTVNVVKP